MRPLRALAVAVLATVLLTGCGGSDEPAAPEPTSAETTAAPASSTLSVEAQAAAANAEAAFDQAYESADAAASDAERYTLRRQALADYDASLRAAALDPVAVERNALLTAIGEEIAVLDQIATGAADDATIDSLLDAHDAVVDAKVALFQVTQ